MSKRENEERCSAEKMSKRANVETTLGDHIDDIAETADKTDNVRDTDDIAELQLESYKHTRRCWAIQEATSSQ